MRKQDNLGQTIHIWHADLAIHTPHLAHYWTCLSVSEKARALRLIDPPRRLFIVSRGLLRQQLAYYLDQSPEAIVLTISERGKPILAGKNEALVDFNLSHSKNKIAFIFAFKRQVGIDIEYKCPRTWMEKTAGRFFSPGEVQTLKMKTGQDKLSFFFERWVAYEARIKALGQSLFSAREAEYADPINTAELSKKLTLMPLTLHTDFAAAAAIEAYDPAATPLLIREIT